MSESPMGEVLSKVVTIAADHPCLPGHFPGRPIVPAVVVLDEVREAIVSTYPGSVPIAIDRCKFLGIVLPGQPFRIELSMKDADTIDFACVSTSEGEPLTTGRFRTAPRDGL